MQNSKEQPPAGGGGGLETNFPAEAMQTALENEQIAQGAERYTAQAAAVEAAKQEGDLLDRQYKPRAPRMEPRGDVRINAPTAPQVAQQLGDVGVKSGGNPHLN